QKLGLTAGPFSVRRAALAGASEIGGQANDLGDLRLRLAGCFEPSLSGREVVVAQDDGEEDIVANALGVEQPAGDILAGDARLEDRIGDVDGKVDAGDCRGARAEGGRP